MCGKSQPTEWEKVAHEREFVTKVGEELSLDEMKERRVKPSSRV